MPVEMIYDKNTTSLVSLTFFNIMQTVDKCYWKYNMFRVFSCNSFTYSAVQKCWKFGQDFAKLSTATLHSFYDRENYEIWSVPALVCNVSQLV